MHESPKLDESAAMIENEFKYVKLNKDFLMSNGKLIRCDILLTWSTKMGGAMKTI